MGSEQRNAGLWQTMNQLLVTSTRELEGREASPTAGVIDSQSVKTTESSEVLGFDAGKKVKGRKRHIMTDTIGCMLFVIVYAVDIQDRDGAPDLIKAIRYRFPWLCGIVLLLSDQGEGVMLVHARKADSRRRPDARST